jgi:UDP-N-acetylmuramyl pentapeptide synthase
MAMIFIEDVIKKGGKVLNVDLFEYAKSYRKKLNCKVIAITGSAGKTTAKDMISSVLSQHYSVTKTHENQNNEFGVPLTLLSADAKTDFLVVEMGMRKKGDIAFLTKIVQPDVVIITNIGLTHIEFFKNQRQLCLGKAEIFRNALAWQTKKGVVLSILIHPIMMYWFKKQQKLAIVFSPLKAKINSQKI